MSRTPVILAVMFFVLLYATAASAEWFVSLRLTWDYAASVLSKNNAHCIAGDPYGNIHIVWYDDREGNNEIYYRKFNGVGWSSDVRLTVNTASSDQPSLAVDAAGRIHVVWVDLASGSPEIHYRMFDGVSWSPEEQLTESSLSAEAPCVAADDSLNIHLVWRDYRYGEWGIYYSTSDGITWSEEVLLTDPGSYPRRPSVAAGETGRLYVVWNDYRDSDYEIYFKTYDGVAWSADERITNEPGLSMNPSLCVDDSNHVHVVWDDDRTGTQVIYHKMWNGISWSADEAITEGTHPARAPAIAPGDSGSLFVVWYAEPSYRHVYFSMFDGYEWGGAEQVSTGSRDSWDPSIAADSDGQPHALWYEDVLYAGSEIYWAWRYDGIPPAPEITTIQPDSGLSGDIVSSASVLGAYFLLPDSLWLEAAGEPKILADNVEVVSSSEITCDFDLVRARHGWRDLIVRNIDGQKDTLVSAFYVVPGPPPVVSSITPDTASTESVVEITNLAGDRFQEYAAVRLEMYGQPAIQATDIVVETAQKITCSIDTYGAAPGFWNVIVENPDGMADTLVSGFAILCSDWEADTRLTYETGDSYLAESNARSIAAGATGDLHVVWYDRRHGWANEEIYYKAFEGGSWGPDVRLTDDPSDSEHPAIALSDDGSIHVVWKDRRDGNAEIYYKKHNGSNWGADMRLTNAEGASGYPAIAVYGATINLVWHDGRAGNHQIYYKRYNGVAWESEYRISTNIDGWSQWPSIAVDEAGNLHVVWKGNIAYGADTDIYYRRFAEGNWKTPVVLTDDPGNSFCPCIWAGPGDDLHVTWYDDRAANYKIFYKHFDGLSWGPDINVTSEGWYAKYASVGADDSGLVHIVWQDQRTGNNEIHYRNYDGLVWSDPLRLTRADGYSGMPCLALCPAGLVHLVWWDDRIDNVEIYYKRRPGAALAGIEDFEMAERVPVRTMVSPNPVRDSGLISFGLPVSSPTRITIYDIAGRLVWKRDLGIRDPGWHNLTWDGCDQDARRVAAGVYFLNIHAGGVTASSKIVVLR